MIENNAYVFRGLPYAIPPVGRYRFRQSQLQTSLEDCWTGTYLANVTRPCWGYDTQVKVVPKITRIYRWQKFDIEIGDIMLTGRFVTQKANP